MQYLLLIYQTEDAFDAASPEERKATLDGYKAFNERTRAAGQYIAGEALQSVATATTVRVQGANTLTTDGPFAETKEQLGGFYMVEAKDLDEAIALAAQIPTAQQGGCVEVRPIMEINFD